MKIDFLLDMKLLLSSLIAAVVSWLIGWILYESLMEKISMPILIGIEFLLFYIVLTVTIAIVNSISRNQEDDILFLDSRVKIVGMLMIGGIVILGLSILFQFLYELNSEIESEHPSSYIFVIDDSGSMESNDPSALRYAAIEEVLDGMPEEFPYMIYQFSHGVNVLRDMAPISEGMEEFPVYNGGDTRIRNVLKQIYADYESGVWSDSVAPRVILLTDGYATDIGLFRSCVGILKKFSKAHITISTVGLGNVDENLMKKIANITNGVFVDVSDTSLIRDAMAEAARHYSSDKDLLSYRSTKELNWLYTILRVLFLSILGTLIGIMMIFASTKEDDTLLIVVSSAIKAILGALLMEVGIQVLGISWQFIWLFDWLLISALITEKEERRIYHSTGTLWDYSSTRRY